MKINFSANGHFQMRVVVFFSRYLSIFSGTGHQAY